MNFFEELEAIFLTVNPDEKIKKFDTFYYEFKKKDDVDFDINFTAKKLDKPKYEEFLNIVLPKEVSVRKHFKTKEGKANLLHTIAHIEYSAIDLALDACIRFANMPKKYYEDWLEVAEDEIRHFKMLEELLYEIGYKYGDLPVHTNLFEAMKKTMTLLERMAIVPRYLEANGLDQNPVIMKKLESNPDKFNNKILKALEIILAEEISHVQKGDYWFKYECDKLNLEYEITYYDILEKFYPGSTQKSQKLNFEARKLAGFSCDELKFLSKNSDCEEK